MITKTIPLRSDQKVNPEKQAKWIYFFGSLPKIDILLKHENFGIKFGVYSICSDILTPGATIYSFGVGKEISFEIELNRILSCE